LGEADAADYAAAQEVLQRRAEALSADVEAEDFRDPVTGIVKRFGGWREKFEEEYSNAYGGLALVQAWEYWARGEMIGWEPTRSSTSLDSFKWYQAVHDYSRPSRPEQAEDQEMDEPELGPDGDLLPPMVSAAVIPNIVKAFEAGAYDVYSAKQSRRVVDLVDLVSVYTTKDNVNFRSILRAVVELFLRHVDATAGLVKAACGPESGQPPAFDPASRTALATFARRRIRLMRNLLMWRRFASSEVAELLRKIVVEILLPCLTKCWDSGGQQLAEEAVKVVPTGVLPEQDAARLQLGPYYR